MKQRKCHGPTIPVKGDQAFNDLEPIARLYFLKVYSPQPNIVTTETALSMWVDYTSEPLCTLSEIVFLESVLSCLCWILHWVILVPVVLGSGKFQACASTY